MSDCFAMEMDDLHRRWLPPEILADIGFADAAVPAPAAIEGLALHLAGLIGGGRKVAPRSACTSPPAPYNNLQLLGRVPVCGLEGQDIMAYGGAPVCPYSPVQWQVTPVATGSVSSVGFELHRTRRLGSPPPAKRRGGGGGTGVFLPRAEMYQAKAAAGKSTGRGNAAGVPESEIEFLHVVKIIIPPPKKIQPDLQIFQKHDFIFIS
ncbi:hypothetical protein GUJ93_ZPchr0009g2362 [Zizania palustris]|uniref:Uncharacterized protein n=1 Tax=Zizania palustris TaxID=103762 RepID=A0A8J5RKI6_ZIZPA|nr:hypothetical protein GUJ93_ZPchr0009g2362 [Zizania palustris]